MERGLGAGQAARDATAAVGIQRTSSLWRSKAGHGHCLAAPTRGLGAALRERRARRGLASPPHLDGPERVQAGPCSGPQKAPERVQSRLLASANGSRSFCWRLCSSSHSFNGMCMGVKGTVQSTELPSVDNYAADSEIAAAATGALTLSLWPSSCHWPWQPQARQYPLQLLLLPPLGRWLHSLC